MIFLSHFQAKKILVAWKLGIKELKVSLDLGRTESKVKIEDNEVIANGFRLNIKYIVRIANDFNSCYFFDGEKLRKIELFDSKFGLYMKLIPTGEFSPPDLSISGIRFYGKNIVDFLNLVSKLAPNKENALCFTSTLGYIPEILIKKNYRKVVAIDPFSIDILEYNPWSSILYSDKITYHNKINYLYSIEESIFDLIVYYPFPYTKSWSYMFSKNIISHLSSILKEDGVIIARILKTKFSKGNIIRNVIKKFEENRVKLLESYNKFKLFLFKKV